MHTFSLGEYVSIKDDGGELHTFVVASVEAVAQEFDRQELAYARSVLDPLPGRAEIHQHVVIVEIDGNLPAEPPERR